MGWLLQALLCPRSHHSLDVGLLHKAAAAGLGRGVAPSSCRHWPRMRDSSSQPSLGRLSLAVQAAAPDLGRGVALGHA